MASSSLSEESFSKGVSLSMNALDLSAQRREPSKGRMPELQILKLEQDFLQVAISGTDVSVVNALRRIIYSEVLGVQLTEHTRWRTHAAHTVHVLNYHGRVLGMPA